MASKTTLFHLRGGFAALRGGLCALVGQNDGCAAAGGDAFGGDGEGGGGSGAGVCAASMNTAPPTFERRCSIRTRDVSSNAH